MKEYTKPTLAKHLYHYGSRQPLFQQDPHSSSSTGGHQSYQNQGFVPRDDQRKFYSRGGRGKLESETPCDTYIQHKSETKNTRRFKFKRLRTSSPICKNTFQGDQINFFSSRKVKIFLGKLGKSYNRFNNSKHSQSLLDRLCRDSLPTKNTYKVKIKPSSDRTCITGGKRNAGEGCQKGGNSLQGPVWQPSVSIIKEGRRATTTDQPEGFEHIHTLQRWKGSMY